MQPSPVQRAVEEIWKLLGLPSPLDEIEDRFAFDLEATPMVLSQEPNGRQVRLSATLGTLSNDLHEAEAQVRRTLSLSLALALVNRAIVRAAELAQPGAAERLGRDASADPVAVIAEIVFEPSASEAEDALRSVLQWQDMLGNVLAPARTPLADATPGPDRDATPGDYLIFQP